MKRRNRPGKSARNKATAKAFSAYVAQVASDNERANLSSKPKPVPFGPRGLTSSTASRERLKLGSSGVGFRAPQGFKSPKYLVSKQESDGTKLFSHRDDLRVTGAKSKPFAYDDYTEGKEAVGDRVKASNWASSKPLNSTVRPHDEALDRLTDPDAIKRREKALKIKR